MIIVKAIEVRFLEGVTIEVTFINGNVYRYDMSNLFDKYPQLRKLEDRKLFESGYVDQGGYGIIWNDELDIDSFTIVDDGEFVKKVETSINFQLGYQITKAREKANLTQNELSKITGIDQADISKLERGQGNPSFKKITKILNGLHAVMEIKIKNI